MKIVAVIGLIRCTSAGHETETGAMLQLQGRGTHSLQGASAGELARLHGAVVQLLQEGATPAVTTFVDETLSSLESKVFPGIKSEHEGDVKLVQGCATRFNEVNANYTARVAAFRDHQTGMEAAARSNHRICREAELDACDAAKECWETYTDLKNDFNAKNQEFLAEVSKNYCPAEEVVNPMQGAAALRKASATVGTQESHYASTVQKHSLRYEAWRLAETKRVRCEQLDAAREQKGEDCGAQRALLEGASCVAMSKYTDATKSFTAEWELGEDFFDSISKAVKSNSADRVKEFAALTEVRCILEAVREKGGKACEAEDAEQTIAACKEQSGDTSRFDINYDMPSKDADVAGPPHPCSPAYDSKEYGDLTDDCFQDLGECSPCEGEAVEATPVDFQLFVLGTMHAHGTIEKYFNFHWDARLDAVESFDGPPHFSRRIRAMQCRKSQKVWAGDITFWHSINGGKGQGDSHGRRSEGAAAHHWEAGDVVTSQDACPDGQGSFAMQVLGTEHSSASSGKYFNFNWQPSLNAYAPMHAFGAQLLTGTVDGAQLCRAGLPVWKGGITFWNSVNGGRTGNAHGRRTAGADSSQWQAGDLLTDGSCPEQLAGSP